MLWNFACGLNLQQQNRQIYGDPGLSEHWSIVRCMFWLIKPPALSYSMSKTVMLCAVKFCPPNVKQLNVHKTVYMNTNKIYHWQKQLKMLEMLRIPICNIWQGAAMIILLSEEFFIILLNSRPIFLAIYSMSRCKCQSRYILHQLIVISGMHCIQC